MSTFSKQLIIFAVSFAAMSFSRTHAQTSVVITFIKSGAGSKLQVVGPLDDVTTEYIPFSKDMPEQKVLKIEMDKWLELGYKLVSTYAYVLPGQEINTSYENLILTKN